MYHYAKLRAVVQSASLLHITTEWADPAKIQMSSFQFEIQLQVINAECSSGGTGSFTDLKTIVVASFGGGDSKEV